MASLGASRQLLDEAMEAQYDPETYVSTIAGSLDGIHGYGLSVIFGLLAGEGSTYQANGDPGSDFEGDGSLQVAS